MTPLADLGAIVPAAGRSVRMGREKLLLPWADTVVVGAVIDALRTGGAADVVLVTASDNERVRRWGRDAEVRVASNPDPERGMLSSIWVGLEAMGGASALAARRCGLLICPGDHPALTARTVSAVRQALATGADLAVPVVDGVRGHPLGVAPRAVPAIPELELTVGLRAILDRYEVREVAVTDRGAVVDLDRPEEYRRALERLQ